jgi:hypothetical protein
MGNRKKRNHTTGEGTMIVDFKRAAIARHTRDYMDIYVEYQIAGKPAKYLLHSRRNDIAQRYEFLSLKKWNESSGKYEVISENVEHSEYEMIAFLALHTAIGCDTTDEQFWSIMKKLRIGAAHQEKRKTGTL